MVRLGAVHNIRTKPAANAPGRYRAEAGVVGRIDECSWAWCRIETGKRFGFISQADLYGVRAGETIDD